MQHGYIYELEREVTRLSRRRMWPVWLFAGLVGIGTGVAWLHHAFPQGEERFVLEAK